MVNKLPTHLPLIEIDYNDVDAEGLTSFRYKDVIANVDLYVNQEVIAYQPEDETYTSAVIKYLNDEHQLGKLEVHWRLMQEYSI